MRVVRYSEDGLSLQYYKQYPKDRRLLPATREEVANLESGHVWYSGAYAAEIEVDDRISGKHLRIPITEYQVGRDIGSIHRAWEEGIPYEEYITKVRNRLKAIDFYKPIWNHFVVPLEGGEVEHLYEDVGFPEWLYGERYPWFVAIRFTAKGEIKERKPRQLSARSAKQLHAQVTSFLTGKKAAVAKWKWSKDKANFYIYAADKEIFSEQPPFNLQDFVNWDMETSIREDWNFEELEKVRPPKEVALAWLEKLLKKLELRAEKSKQRSKGKRTRKVDFYLYFKDRKSAKAFYEKVREKGFVLKSMRRVEFSKGFPISVILEKAYTRSAGEESLDINSLDELASEFDGEFDGTGREI
ncbi:MAG TPA: ribonuclease E inhibitor RraB [Fimbriimonadales bacterium]|nr:ribonuclease E inhibitor RraB [Fimbriimonadales bacterium]